MGNLSAKPLTHGEADNRVQELLGRDARAVRLKAGPGRCTVRLWPRGVPTGGWGTKDWYVAAADFVELGRGETWEEAIEQAGAKKKVDGNG